MLDQARQVGNRLGSLLRFAKLAQQHSQMQARASIGLRITQRIDQQASDSQHGTSLIQVLIAIHAQAGQVVLGLPAARLYRTLQPILSRLVIQIVRRGVAQAAAVQLVQA
ncbi:hypothetical protein D3C81_1539410 [compost metagenome]